MTPTLADMTSSSPSPSATKLVLLPGMDGTGEMFADFVTALPKSFRIRIVRYPGERHLSYAELENLVCEAGPASEPFVLLAESYSTPTAIRYAAMHPENLIALILCAGFAISPVPGWLRSPISILAPLVVNLPLPRTVAEHWLVGPEAPDSLLKALRIAILSVRPVVLAALLRAVLSCDQIAQLRDVTVPVLYVQAKQDRLISVSCLEEIRRINPRVRVAAINGPHLLLQRQPWEAAAVVSAFVEEHVQHA
jgi:pimeloyl-ACP methyl ester carboxylesterase